MGQTPITFIRQVLALVIYPDLISCINVPDDVKKRAQDILNACGGKSAGAYTGSHGIDMIRKNVANYIKNRDGYDSDFNNICLSGGASAAIKYVMELFCNNPCKKSGVMIPIPQYPLYSASIAQFGLEPVGYYLDEDNNWALDVSELQRAIKEAESRCQVRAIVVINPGNPTGSVLSPDNVKTIIKFAKEHNLFIFADEVYQDNVYPSDMKFVSFKKVMMEMGSPFSEMEVASFMSLSKGYMGECGLRGGWMELVNMDKDVQAHLFKAISSNLCPTSLGQAGMDCVAKPPAPGEPSHERWLGEKSAVLASLKSRAKLAADAFNAMPGFKCNEVRGAMYAFPRFEIPKKAIEEAKKQNKAADVFYAFKLLEETGICVVAGSGFGQKPGTYHFRTTILPQPKLLKEMLDIFKNFQEKFLKEFS
ncbi:alanine aminotransferase 1-like isoform X2 [Hyposmocoma kahamanoa]|nr:alanine aminotransferase 1-like isoform X2 [Hyposmocoma kahamanoa]XP_026327968.1 alanine aminotransferase 1-like isoform X2 [Hyposmocoma kahamanoa]